MPHSGTCADDEICVNGAGAPENWTLGDATVALCVKSSAFTDVTSAEGEELKPGGAVVKAVLVGEDWKTPPMG